MGQGRVEERRALARANFACQPMRRSDRSMDLVQVRMPQAANIQAGESTRQGVRAAVVQGAVGDEWRVKAVAPAGELAHITLAHRLAWQSPPITKAATREQAVPSRRHRPFSRADCGRPHPGTGRGFIPAPSRMPTAIKQCQAASAPPSGPSTGAGMCGSASKPHAASGSRTSFPAPFSGFACSSSTIHCARRAAASIGTPPRSV